jgi:hypothetical protein
MRRSKKRAGFALYEVLLGVTIFVVGVLVLGRSVQNCMMASALGEDENRVRLLLANRMAELQATPTVPDATADTKIDTGFGIVRLLQKTQPKELKNSDDTEVDDISQVTLTAEWFRAGIKQSKQIVFYVYRAT